MMQTAPLMPHPAAMRGPPGLGPKQPPAGATICHIHQKTRGPNNVEEIPGTNPRQFKCKPGSECKLPESQVPLLKENAVMPPGKVACAVHGKTRGPNNVEPYFAGPGQWRCKAGSECKIPAATPGVMKVPDGTTPPGTVVCSLHNKSRGPNNVVETWIGNTRQWRCREGSECKLPANGMEMQKDLQGMPGQSATIHPQEPTLCWAHAKKRSPNQLHQVNTHFGIEWECLPQFKCKGSGGVPAQMTAPAGATGSGTPYPVPLTSMDGLGYLPMMMNNMHVGAHMQLAGLQGGYMGVGLGTEGMNGHDARNRHPRPGI